MGIAVKVTNISAKASLQDVYDFFSFSGPIGSVHLETDAAEDTQTAHVGFTEQKSLETALLLAGAMIVDKVVQVEAVMDYEPPSNAKIYPTSTEGPGALPAATPIKRAEEMMRSLVSRGYVLGQDAMQRARNFDERIEFSRTAAAGTAAIRDGFVALPGTITTGAMALPGTISAGASSISAGAMALPATITAGAMALPTTISAGAKALGDNVAATAATIDKKLSISQSFSAGTATVGRSIAAVDDKLHISEKTRGAFLAAETKLSEAGEVLAQNKLVTSSREWVMGMTSKITSYVDGEKSELSPAELEVVKAAAASETIVSVASGKDNGPAAKIAEDAPKGPAAVGETSKQEETVSASARSDVKASDKAAPEAVSPAVKAHDEDKPVF